MGPLAHFLRKGNAIAFLISLASFLVRMPTKSYMLGLICFFEFLITVSNSVKVASSVTFSTSSIKWIFLASVTERVSIEQYNKELDEK